MSIGSALIRLFRSAETWGWKRTLIKVAGRTGFPRPTLKNTGKNAPDISVIGCGQAAYATLCYYLAENLGSRFLYCYDIAEAAAQRLQRSYGFANHLTDEATFWRQPDTKYIYIASNHASHTGYAVAALERGITVFCEKPLCTSWNDLQQLTAAVNMADALFYAGYNRPFSPAISWLRSQIESRAKAFTLNCTVHGHFLPENHWYRKPEEGTRISGNMGHWIDLAVHLFYQRGVIPKRIDIGLVGVGSQMPLDDNVVLILTSDTGDLVSIALNARHEPFEGIREVIDYQDDDLAVHINDFRELAWWRGAKRGHVRYARKDVGHEACTMQPFRKDGLQRSWGELELTTALTLAVSDLARSGGGSALFDVAALALAP